MKKYKERRKDELKITEFQMEVQYKVEINE